ncbi:MAG: MerR family transcriptional regulator [Candidatus Omnitrophica bacterium]|nr:MerR family transcriptional regulator [Candidatus Omnitrophota bacterium]
MKKEGKLVSSMELVRKFGISYSTLTHYTNLGLLRVVQKNGNKKLYQINRAKRRLNKIKKLSTEGYPLKIIRKILSDGDKK